MSKWAILVLSTATLACHGDALAQWRVGASVGGFSSSTYDFEGSESKVTGFSLGGDSSLVAGYQVTEEIEVGATISFSSSDIESAAGTNQVDTASAFGAYLDYHFNPGAETLFFAGPRVGTGSAKTEVDGEVYGESDVSTLGVAGGLKYFVAKNISFDATAGYTFGTLETADVEVDATIVTLGVGFSARL